MANKDVFDGLHRQAETDIPTVVGKLKPKMKKKIKVERWVSSNNEKEIHYFLDGRSNTYFMGFNPALIDESKFLRAIEEITGIEIVESIE